MNAPTLILDGDKQVPRAPTAGLAPSLERRRLRLYILQMLIDVSLLLGACAFVAFVYAGSGIVLNALLPAQLMLPLFLTIAWHILSSRLQADLEYLAGWSIWRDLSIAFSTVRVVIHDRAY